MVGVHPAPGVQAAQVPRPSQTPPVHAAPAGDEPLGTQVREPVLQSPVPVWHSTPGSQGSPGVQPLHTPAPSHTPPGQTVPAGNGTLAGHAVDAPSHAAAAAQGVAARHAVPASSGPTEEHVTAPAQESSPRSHAASGHAPPLTHGTHAPAASHTPPLQGVPGAAGPASLHTAAPELHAMTPARHSPAGVQLAPSMHVTHVPAPLHTPLGHNEPAGSGAFAGQPNPAPSHAASATQGPVAARQTSPAGAGPVPSHVPAGQVSVPRSQSWTPRQLAPGTQLGTHVPLPSQDPSPGHGASTIANPFAGHEPAASHRSAGSQTPVDGRQMAPSGAGPVVTQTGAPELQSTAPSSQLSVTHGASGTQVSQTPASLHASPGPHPTPAGRVSPAMHCARPSKQRVTPRTHGLPVLQVAPSMHAVHSPPSQTPPEPQTVVTSTSSSTHTGLPEPQSVRPETHGLPVLQTALGTHTSQLPASPQTSPDAHPTPCGKVSTGTQTVPASPHIARPTEHGSPVLQVAPSMHSLHAPSMHTPAPPQGVASSSRPRTQTGSPVEQSTSPSAQGSPVLHAIPSKQTEHAPASSHAAPVPQRVPSG